MKRGQLFVSFWDLSLENIPEGTFTHRRVTPGEAKRLIEKARKAGTLRCASHEDLLAPYKKRESDNHKELCRVLGKQHGIAMSLRDFVSKYEIEGTEGYTIRPLAFAEVDASNRLMIVNCHYVMAKERKRGELRFAIDPQSVTFHLVEAIGRPSTTKSKRP